MTIQVVSKRDQDLLLKGDLVARSERLTWHLAAASILLPFSAGMRHPLQGPFLLICCKWVFDAVKAFEQLYFEDGAGRTRSIRVSSKANTAKGLQVCQQQPRFLYGDSCLLTPILHIKPAPQPCLHVMNSINPD